MNWARWAMALSAGWALVLPGCGGDKGGQGGGPAERGEAKPGRVTVRQSSARQALETYYLALACMDVDALVELAPPDDKPAARAVAACVRDLLARHGELVELAAARFGKDVADSIRDELDEINRGQQALVENGKVLWPRIELTEAGDQATATAGRGRPIPLVRIAGTWYVLFAGGGSGTTQPARAWADELRAYCAARLARADEVIRKVKAGQMTKQQFQQAIKER